MELWTALTIGFLGSFHCVGMCGAIALALPHGNAGRMRFVGGRLLYNFGRVATYSFLGLIFGLLGSAIRLTGFQEALSISLGILILLVTFLPARYSTRFFAFAGLSGAISSLKTALGGLFRKNTFGSLFFIGILNGLLPCGFVYMGIAGSLTAGSVGNSVIYMALFGLGTIPAMLLTSLASGIITVNVRTLIRRLIPVGATVMALLFILRGLSLGIPYVSPKLGENPVEQLEGCCRK